MKKTTKIFGVLSTLLLLSVAVVYAHSSTQEETSIEPFEGVIDVEEMDEMHDLMTEGLDPELKEQMDLMHDGCTSQFKKEGNEDYMEKMGSSMMMGGGMMG